VFRKLFANLRPLITTAPTPRQCGSLGLFFTHEVVRTKKSQGIEVEHDQFSLEAYVLKTTEAHFVDIDYKKIFTGLDLFERSSDRPVLIFAQSGRAIKSLFQALLPAIERYTLKPHQTVPEEQWSKNKAVVQKVPSLLTRFWRERNQLHHHWGYYSITRTDSESPEPKAPRQYRITNHYRLQSQTQQSQGSMSMHTLMYNDNKESLVNDLGTIMANCLTPKASFLQDQLVAMTK
jgi:hypothetical protein